MHQRKPTFTLIELLIVITIVTILSALVMPGLAKSRAKSHQLRSKNFLKVIGTNITAYLNDQSASAGIPRLPAADSSDTGAFDELDDPTCPFYLLPYAYDNDNGSSFVAGGLFTPSDSTAASDLVEVEGAEDSTIKYRPPTPYALRADMSVGEENGS